MRRFNINVARLWFALPAVFGTGLLLAGLSFAQEPDNREPVENPEQARQTPTPESGSEADAGDGESEGASKADTGDDASQTPETGEEKLREFIPSDQIRADSEVTFPADI